jgi:cytochrome c biogenesis protein CcdA
VFATALAAGLAFGARHAVESDHVAAVATLVEDGQSSFSTGAAWGVGHSLPILALGAVFVGLGLRPPPVVASGFELVVGLVLVVLGVRAVAGREPLGTAVVRHVHGDDEAGDHHRHLRIAGRTVGLTHSHAAGESFAVGVVHGLAGSAGVVVALAATAGGPVDGAGFLAGFSAASVGAMAVAAWAWGRAVGHAARLRVLAGVASVAVGLLLVASSAGVSVPV